jgi:hypothetical protein
MPPKRAASGRVSEVAKRLCPGSLKSGADAAASSMDGISIACIEDRVTSKILVKVPLVVSDTRKDQQQSPLPSHVPSPSVSTLIT